MFISEKLVKYIYTKKYNAVIKKSVKNQLSMTDLKDFQCFGSQLELRNMEQKLDSQLNNEVSSIQFSLFYVSAAGEALS